MKKPIDTQNIILHKCMRETLTLEAAIKESNRCLLCHDAPCSAGCPAGTDPGKFIRQIKFYNYKGAARTIRSNNILGSVCAHICPVEKLCEKACSIKALEDPININGLQRFATEYGKIHKLEPLKRSKKNNGKIAIIGCGPAGMSCASQLAKMDYDVCIFEREPSAGGVIKWNIPEFRLPEDALNYDIENLANQGVEIKFNSAIDSKESLNKLKSEGFEAVFISSGLSEAFMLDMFKTYTNALDYITFLRQVKFGKDKLNLKDKNIAVIGGGSVAIDSAVSAKSCGANRVYLISLEHLAELPADEEEIKLAQLMKIIFKSGSQVTGVIQDGNIITGIKGIEIDWVQEGKFTPDNARQVSGTEFSLNVDLVVQAIGTKPGKEVGNFAEGIKTKGKGVIMVNDTFETNIPWIFAGGDVVNGGATVVQAVAEGKKAAESMDKYLKNRR
ncbi:MAG: FAD-dependent oxidoreductase [Bacteroidales bacterium]|nr:FAD-dependent oxidoreductase [Bacteroidales bacterium]